MTHCVVLTNTTNVNVHALDKLYTLYSAFKFPDQFV